MSEKERIMRLVNAFVVFAILSLGVILVWTSHNPGDPHEAELVSASVWLLAIALALLAIYTVVRNRARGR